jgi:hypothetical protein
MAMTINLLPNPTKPHHTVEAVAIKATYGGRGSAAVGYQVKDADGRWYVITKKDNPHLKVTIKRPVWDGHQWSDGWHRVGCILESPEVPLVAPEPAAVK